MFVKLLPPGDNFGDEVAVVQDALVQGVFHYFFPVDEAAVAALMRLTWKVPFIRIPFVGAADGQSNYDAPAERGGGEGTGNGNCIVFVHHVSFSEEEEEERL